MRDQHQGTVIEAEIGNVKEIATGIVTVIDIIPIVTGRGIETPEKHGNPEKETVQEAVARGLKGRGNGIIENGNQKNPQECQDQEINRPLKHRRQPGTPRQNPDTTRNARTEKEIEKENRAVVATAREIEIGIEKDVRNLIGHDIKRSFATLKKKTLVHLCGN